MVNYSRTVDSNYNRHPSYAVDSPRCEVCKDRKYVLVASRKLNRSSTVYERQVCQACANTEKVSPDEGNRVEPQSAKKTLSGTGYLRNKKRRRKEAS